MQKKAGASPSGKAMAVPSRKVPGVRRSFFVGSCHSRRNASSLPLWSARTVSDLMVGSGRLGRVMTWPLSEMTIGVALLQSGEDRKSTRLNSSHGYISYAVFCLKKKTYNKH